MYSTRVKSASSFRSGDGVYPGPKQPCTRASLKPPPTSMVPSDHRDSRMAMSTSHAPAVSLCHPSSFFKLPGPNNCRNVLQDIVRTTVCNVNQPAGKPIIECVAVSCYAGVLLIHWFVTPFVFNRSTFTCLRHIQLRAAFI